MFQIIREFRVVVGIEGFSVLRVFATLRVQGIWVQGV